MKIISISDLHIHAGMNEDEEWSVVHLVSAITGEKPDILVLNGDIADPWKSDWDGILGCDSWHNLQELVRVIAADGKMTYWVADNHDHGGKPEHLPGAEVVRRFRYQHYEFRHGWEWDWTWGGFGWIPGVAPVAFWLSSHAPWLMIPLHNLLRGKKQTPGQNKRAAVFVTIPDAMIETTYAQNKGPEQDWNLQVATIHTRARAYAKKHNVVVVLGHTHHPTPFDGLIVNSGDLDDRKYVRITTGLVELVDF